MQRSAVRKGSYQRSAFRFQFRFLCLSSFFDVGLWTLDYLCLTHHCSWTSGYPRIKYGAGPVKYKADQDFTGQAYQVRYDGIPRIGVQGRARESSAMVVLRYPSPVTGYWLPVTGYCLLTLDVGPWTGSILFTCLFSAPDWAFMSFPLLHNP
jgi:hypothetical protein